VKYVAALPVFLVFALLDVMVILLCALALGLLIVDQLGQRWPFSVGFAKSREPQTRTFTQCAPRRSSTHGSAASRQAEDRCCSRASRNPSSKGPGCVSCTRA